MHLAGCQSKRKSLYIHLKNRCPDKLNFVTMQQVCLNIFPFINQRGKVVRPHKFFPRGVVFVPKIAALDLYRSARGELVALPKPTAYDHEPAAQIGLARWSVSVSYTHLIENYILVQTLCRPHALGHPAASVFADRPVSFSHILCFTIPWAICGVNAATAVSPRAAPP